MEASGINLNTTAQDEHVPEIERYIPTIKERIRAKTNTLPFEQLPHHLIVEIAYNAVFWLNCLLKGIEYNSSTKGKCASDINEIVSTNCESEKWNTEVEKDEKVSFDNVTNAG